MPGMPTGILISQQPVFQVAIEGTTGVQFTASAIGASGVQWYRNGTGIAGGTGAIYTLPLLDVTGFNGSLYKATFTNGVDSPVTTAEVPLWVVARFIPTDGTYGSGNYGGGLYKFEANTDKRHYYALKKIWPLKVLDGVQAEAVKTSVQNRAMQLFTQRLTTGIETSRILRNEELLHIETEVSQGLRDVEPTSPNEGDPSPVALKAQAEKKTKAAA